MERAEEQQEGIAPLQEGDPVAWLAIPGVGLVMSRAEPCLHRWPWLKRWWCVGVMRAERTGKST